MLDRLADLKRFGGGSKAPESDIEMGRLEPAGSSNSAGGGTPPAGLSDFYKEVDAIKSEIRLLEDKIGQVDEKMAASLAAVSAEKAEGLSTELDGLIKQCNASSRSLSDRIKSLQRQKGGESSPNQKGNAEVRLKECMVVALARKFYELMSVYQDLKARHASRYRDKVRRHVEIASGEAPTEEQVDAIVEGGDPNRLFAQKILQDKRHQDAANALIFIKERHNDILRLEKSINELHQIFVDMAMLVEQQGEMLDQIEYSVNKSQAYTEDAVKELVKANRWARKNRKLILILSGIGICCVIIIIVVILVYLWLNNKI